MLAPILRETPLRAIIGLPFVLLVPGYAFVAALFPEAGESRNVSFEPSFGEPGRYNVTVTVTGSVGGSDEAMVPVVANDRPTVTIDGAENVTAEGETVLAANVTNVVGSTTVTWTLPDGSTTRGTELSASLSDGDAIRVQVRDKYGATGTDEVTVEIGEGGGAGDGGPIPQLNVLPLPIPLWLQFALTAASVLAVAASVRSGSTRHVVDRARAAGGATIEAVGAAPPRVEIVENPWWDPERESIVIDDLAVESPSGFLASVEITVADGDGETIVTKTIDLTGQTSYASNPERVHVYGGIEPSDESHTIGVRAIDERERVGTWQQSRDELFTGSTPDRL